MVHITSEDDIASHPIGGSSKDWTGEHNYREYKCMVLKGG